jgi:hypothetical protein
MKGRPIFIECQGEPMSLSMREAKRFVAIETLPGIQGKTAKRSRSALARRPGC